MNQQILELLRVQRDGFVSGQEIADKIGISRIAVWKQVQGLKKLGYQIHSRKKNGYSLQAVPDLLLPAEIRDGLKTRVMGSKIHYFPALGSTNDQARKMAAEAAPEGTVVIAEKQTSGKGRLGRSWFSPAGHNIYFSVILRPPITPALAPLLTLLTGVAVASAIKKTCAVNIGLKWPNDLMVKDGGYKKVGGILTEMGAESDRINYLVVGCGLNVNMSPAFLTPELKRTAASLHTYIKGARTVSRVKLMKDILTELERYYHRFLSGKWPEIISEYRELDILRGQAVKVKQGGEIISGKAGSIDDEGRLVIKTGAKTRDVVAGEVTLLKG